jgi:hypothetical protein
VTPADETPSEAKGGDAMETDAAPPGSGTRLARMLGIDCEMCTTTEGLELTRSVRHSVVTRGVPAGGGRSLAKASESLRDPLVQRRMC